VTACLRLATLFVLGLGLSGCLVPIPHWRTIEYDLGGIEILPQLEAVALYQFRDARDLSGHGPTTRIGELALRGGSGRTYPQDFFFNREPVAATVTRAFAAGLTARGFPVVDHTGELFAPSQSTSATRLALSGDVLRSLDVRIVTSVGARENPVITPVLCTVRVYVYDTTTGKAIWDKGYSADKAKGVTSFDELLPLFGLVLSQVVRDVVSDPDFLAQFQH
jgi:hypothetical protein